MQNGHAAEIYKALLGTKPCMDAQGDRNDRRAQSEPGKPAPTCIALLFVVESAVIENCNMTSKKSSHSTKAKAKTKPAAEGRTLPTPAAMVKASESAWSGTSVLGQSKSSGLSRQRMVDARSGLVQIEQQFISLAVEAQESMQQEADTLGRKATKVQEETWAIEQEAATKTAVLRAQARMEAQLAKHIRDIAERSALSILDRIKEASDSLMDWAGLISDDMTGMLRKEAAEQIERKVAEIKAIEEALDEEDRATELIELTARYQKDLAA